MAGNAKELRKLWSGFQSARVLLTANNLGVFDHLKKSQAPEALARTLGTDRRGTAVLLDALVSLGLLRKQGGKYRNTPMSNRHLARDGAEYQGDILRHADTLWQNWSALDEVVMTGRPAGRAFDYHSFMMGMHNLAVLKAREVVKAAKLRNVRKALDLGSGPGTYAMEMATRGVSVTMFDRPEAIKIAKKLASKQKIKGIRFLEGDFVADPIGMGYDLIFISQIFHAYSADDNIFILEKCHKALNPGGRVVVQEFYINNELTYPQWSALFSVNMLVNTEGGRCYSPDEITGWFAETGFGKTRRRQLDDTVLIEATKPA
ncbi:MAG: methyltransferase [Nitrospirota bacterium]|jgi:ubiquinone/menaquinone biosynthesis C-methylase UbiE